MPRPAEFLILFLALGVSPVPAQTWQQNANGQSATDACGNGIVFPNNRNWSQQLVTATCGQPPMSYTAQPSNWSTPQYPNSLQALVTLDGPSVTLADVEVQFETLTIGPSGGLNLDATGRLTGKNLTLQRDVTIARENTQPGTKGEIHLSGGTIAKTGGTGTASFDGTTGGGVALHLKDTTVRVLTGKLVLPGRGSVRGLTVAAGSVDLTGGQSGAIWSGTLTGLSGTRTLLSGGEIRLTDADLTLQFPTGFAVAGEWSGGSFVGSGAAGAGILRNTGIWTLTEPTLKSLVRLNVQNSGTLEIRAGTLGLTDGSELRNSGTLILSRSDGFSGQQSSMVRIAGGVGLPPRVVNTGTFIRYGSPEEVLAPDLEFINDRGTVRVGYGRLTIRNGFLLGGSYVASGTLTFGGINGLVSMADTLTGSGNNEGVVFVGGTFLARSTDLQGQPLPPVVLNFPNPTLRWQGGTFASDNGAEITNTGTINAFEANPLNIATPFHNDGTIYLDGFITVAPGLTFRNSGTLLPAGAGGRPSGLAAGVGAGSVATLENTGSIAPLSLAVFRLPVRNSGEVLADGTSIEFQAGFTQTDGVIYLARGGRITSTGAPLVFLGGTLRGTLQGGIGTIVGNIEQRGPLELGRFGGGTLARLTVQGDFTQIGAPPLTVHLGGATANEYGRLDITGTATLAGALTVNLVGGFKLRAGDVFTIFQAGAISGAFSSVTLPPGVRGQVTVSGGALTLRITAAPAAASLVNLSTRGRVETGDNTMIGGSVIGGSAPKRVLVRAIGPSLTAFGVIGALANPQLRLVSSETQATVAENDDWRGTQQAEITASGFAPTDQRESALIATLAPGAYTALVTGVGGEMGVGLLEVYDLESGARETSRPINVSTRARVLTESGVLIGGFVVEGTRPRRVLVRALGPSLTAFGVQGALADPVLELKNATGTTLASNDSWATNQASEITETGLAPQNSAEAAIVLTLEPGAYTAIVRGAASTTGVGLVEVYDLE
ncbi:MAG: hypothetical protein JSR82_13060 [Verrucomicrobia bacterium]|nr:hypothetical protein [Verrucomicrobiota bacterium]